LSVQTPNRCFSGRGGHNGIRRSTALPAAAPLSLLQNWKYEPTPYGETVKKALLEAAKR